MLTIPQKRPSAKYWPSFVQLQQVMRLLSLCFDTDFCSGDHNPENQRTWKKQCQGFKVRSKLPKSVQAQDASWCDTGLYAKHWIASLCLKIWLKHIRRLYQNFNDQRRNHTLTRRSNTFVRVKNSIIVLMERLQYFFLRIFQDAFCLARPYNHTVVSWTGSKAFSIFWIRHTEDGIFVT